MMGYSSFFTGEFTFSRELSADELDAVLDAHDAAGGESQYPFSITRNGMNTEDADFGKMYSFIKTTEAAIAALPADVTVNGMVERTGEEWPDADRFYVDVVDGERQLVRVRPRVTWTNPLTHEIEVAELVNWP
jgi:hypothetical protein